MKKTEKEKMLSGKLYKALDKELFQMSSKAKKLIDEYNNVEYSDFLRREKILKELLGSIGKNCMINKPFFCDYGVNIQIGDNFFANFDCVILDVNQVIIGDNVFLGPKVSIYTATHPIDAEVRISLLEYGKPVEIGNNVWIGGNAVINPGVIIGNNVVIGSGSVVTKDIPDNVIAVGNPCKVLRKITDDDKKYWQKQKEIYENS